MSGAMDVAAPPMNSLEGAAARMASKRLQALADRPRPRMSVVCRATCRVRDLRVLYGGVGCSKPRSAATPHAAPRGLYSSNDWPHRFVRVAPLHRRDRRCGSARWRAVRAFLQARNGPFAGCAANRDGRRFSRPAASTAESPVTVRFGCRPRVGARRANRPLGGRHGRARAPPARSRHVHHAPACQHFTTAPAPPRRGRTLTSSGRAASKR